MKRDFLYNCKQQTKETFVNTLNCQYKKKRQEGGKDKHVGLIVPVKKASTENGQKSISKDIEQVEIDKLKDNYVSHHINLTNDQIPYWPLHIKQKHN